MQNLRGLAKCHHAIPLMLLSDAPLPQRLVRLRVRHRPGLSGRSNGKQLSDLRPMSSRKGVFIGFHPTLDLGPHARLLKDRDQLRTVVP
eukprot:5046767-Alexandrium_andersonii.AAC.1